MHVDFQIFVLYYIGMWSAWMQILPRKANIMFRYVEHHLQSCKHHDMCHKFYIQPFYPPVDALYLSQQTLTTKQR